MKDERMPWWARVLLVLGFFGFIAALAWATKRDEERARSRPCSDFLEMPVREVPWRCLREGKTERDNPILYYW